MKEEALAREKVICFEWIFAMKKWMFLLLDARLLISLHLLSFTNRIFFFIKKFICIYVRVGKNLSVNTWKNIGRSFCEFSLSKWLPAKCLRLNSEIILCLWWLEKTSVSLCDQQYRETRVIKTHTLWFPFYVGVNFFLFQDCKIFISLFISVFKRTLKFVACLKFSNEILLLLYIDFLEPFSLSLLLLSKRFGSYILQLSGWL